MVKHPVISLALMVLGCQAPAPAALPDSAAPSLVVRGARVFDGERMLGVRTVLVRDGLILGFGQDESFPDDVEVIDGSGCTLLPGLIDAHCHVTEEADLAQALVFGVTTELDMFTFLDLDRARVLRMEQAEGQRTDLADFRMAGTPVTCDGGVGVFFKPDIPTISDANGAQRFIDERLREGSDYIKIMHEDGHAFGASVPTLSLEMLKRSVEATHLRSKLALVHVTSLSRAREAIEAGADGIVHIFADAPPDSSLCEGAAGMTFVVPTLSLTESGFGTPSGAALVEDERIAPFLSSGALDNLRNLDPGNRRALGSYEIARSAVASFHEAGVTILAGSDAPNAGTTHGASIHRELELLVACGLSPTEALASATARPADCFRLRDRGRIAPGLRADLLLVRGNPAEDIRATRDIVAVLKLGSLAERDAYRAHIASASTK